MEAVLLKTNLQKTKRYRLFELKDSSIEQLASESTLPDIISEIARLDHPMVKIELSDLDQERMKLISSNSKLEELSTSEKCRYRNYCK